MPRFRISKVGIVHQIPTRSRSRSTCHDKRSRKPGSIDRHRLVRRILRCVMVRREQSRRSSRRVSPSFSRPINTPVAPAINISARCISVRVRQKSFPCMQMSDSALISVNVVETDRLVLREHKKSSYGAKNDLHIAHYKRIIYVYVACLHR